MKIAIVGSITFEDRIQSIRRELEESGFSVWAPIDGNDTSPEAMRRYNQTSRDNIGSSHAVLVVNERKHDIDGYIGANVLIEIGIAYALHKPTYLLNDYDKDQSNATELAALTEGVIGNVQNLVEKLEEKR